MRWSIIRLIWVRELRDQLRDRRTLFMIAVLPLLLYPVLGFAVLRFTLGVVERQSTIGIVRAVSGTNGEFPERPPVTQEFVPVCVAWFSVTPMQPFPNGPVGAFTLSAAADRLADTPDGVLATAVWQARFPPLLHIENSQPILVDGKKVPTLPASLSEQTTAVLTPEQMEDLAKAIQAGQNPEMLIAAQHVKNIRFEFYDPEAAKEALERKQVDLLISASPGFYAKVKKTETQDSAGQAFIKIESKTGRERYRIAKTRIDYLLDLWKKDMKNVRLADRRLPSHFDEPYVVDEDITQETAGNQPQRILDLMKRIFPFMLVMWSLAGALYPAVDLCAGEKERGTMETLLISPAGREEIVVGKFLTIWMFSGGTALLNLVSMGLTTMMSAKQLPLGSLPPESLLWCMVLLLPLSAFFSALCLAVGAYARSSKEGQYYLMPLFLVTMPLMFLTLAPGVELSPFYSLVPVTGAALLMQQLMTPSAPVPWLYFIPVLAPIVLYSYLALRWAIAQFQREEVLFREAERLDIGLWIGRLFREKEETPSTGQAFFIFAVVLLLHWLSLSIGRPIVTHTSIALLAFVATPPLFLTMILNTKPLLGLKLVWPKLGELGLAALLAVLLLPPVAYVSVVVLTKYPNVALLLKGQPMVEQLGSIIDGRPLNDAIPYLLGLALLPALSEELCFRGFILTGMLKSFRPRTAVVLVSFLFALYHMNVFLFLPAFFIGMVLGLLTLRSHSIVPAFVFHLLFKTVLIVGVHVYGQAKEDVPKIVNDFWLPSISIGLAAAMVLLWRLYRAPEELLRAKGLHGVTDPRDFE
jgi:sodium transport system permease protein